MMVRTPAGAWMFCARGYVAQTHIETRFINRSSTFISWYRAMVEDTMGKSHPLDDISYSTREEAQEALDKFFDSIH